MRESTIAAATQYTGCHVYLVLLVFVFLATACSMQGKAVEPGNVSTNQVKIQVAVDGFYRLTLEELRGAGLNPVTLGPDNLHLSQAGTAVPFFTDDESLIFYGRAPDNRYLTTRPYVLEYGNPGVSISESTAAHTDAPILEQIPLVKRLEENNFYNPQAVGAEDDDRWLWEVINFQQKVPLTVDLPNVGDGSATLSLNLWGVTHDPRVENDHDLNLILNGQNLGTIRWDGQTFFDYSVDIPRGGLRADENSLVLDNETDGAAKIDIMQLNWLELTYMAPPVADGDLLEFRGSDGPVMASGFSGRPNIYDISDPDTPRRLTGWKFDDDLAIVGTSSSMHLVAIGPNGYMRPASIEAVRQSDWRQPDNQADLLIVTTDELAPALTPLAEARVAQGLSVAVVPVAEIYDAFGYGAASPESIQAFVAYAFENWQPPSPAYLFLVGDATSDYRDYLGLAPKNAIPSPMVPVTYGGETVSDSRLADVDGDMRPDLAVGRWPVTDKKDVEALVERTLAYEQGAADETALFTTDGTEARFAALANELWNASNIPASQIKLLDGPQASEVTDQWNEGAWLTTYIGHGSIQLWGKDNVFNPEAVPDLQDQTPPIVLQLTCLTGLFAHPELTSLSETMLTHEQGPVLIVAATSLTLSDFQEPFGRSFLQSLRDPAIDRIGDAFQQAKQALDVEKSDGLREVSDTFALLGDPTTRIVRPE